MPNHLGTTGRQYTNFFLQSHFKMMKIQAVVIVNDGAEMDAEKAIHNSETKKQTQIVEEQILNSLVSLFKKKGYSSVFNSHLFYSQNMNSG